MSAIPAIGSGAAASTRAAPARPILGQGCGVDLVGVAPFAAQLAEPGSAFPRVFTDREWGRCLALDAHAPGPSSARAWAGAPTPAAPLGPRAAESLAARWAAKEAAIKAWSELIAPEPPALDPETLNWSDIEVVSDRFDRPTLRFRGAVAAALAELEEHVGGRLDWTLSLSHDAGLAIALVHLLALAPIDEGEATPLDGSADPDQPGLSAARGAAARPARRLRTRRKRPA